MSNSLTQVLELVKQSTCASICLCSLASLYCRMLTEAILKQASWGNLRNVRAIPLSHTETLASNIEPKHGLLWRASVQLVKATVKPSCAACVFACLFLAQAASSMRERPCFLQQQKPK